MVTLKYIDVGTKIMILWHLEAEISKHIGFMSLIYVTVHVWGATSEGTLVKSQLSVVHPSLFNVTSQIHVNDWFSVDFQHILVLYPMVFQLKVQSFHNDFVETVNENTSSMAAILDFKMAVTDTHFIMPPLNLLPYNI